MTHNPNMVTVWARDHGLDEFMSHDEATAAYTAALSTGQVPEGWRLVPEMLSRDHFLLASKKMRYGVRRKLDSSADAENAYAAFLAAAPSPPAAQEG